MSNITAPNLLLRTGAELPKGFRLSTEEFREGWGISRSVEVCRLEKRILNRGWNFIKVADGRRSYGVGDTSQGAVDSALQHALRQLSENFNAAAVECIELTQYRWFFLASLALCPYRIQQGAALPAPDHTGRISGSPERKRLPRKPAALYSRSSGITPMFKEMLILSRSIHEKMQ